MAKSLKARIDELIDALGSANKPTLPQIRSRLFKFAALAEELEQGKAVRKAESKVAALQSALEKSELENSNLGTELKAALDEVRLFKVEQREREKKDAELPKIQFEILERLPSQHGGLGLTMQEIWREVGARLDEIEIHVDKLEKAGLIAWHMEADGEKFWRRTMTGNELVVAKRLAREETGEREQKRYADLRQSEALVLLAVGKSGAKGATVDEIVKGVNEALPTIGKPYSNGHMVAILLTKLQEKKMVSWGNELDPREPRKWYVLDDGMKYLAERKRS